MYFGIREASVSYHGIPDLISTLTSRVINGDLIDTQIFIPTWRALSDVLILLSHVFTSEYTNMEFRLDQQLLSGAYLI